MEKKKKGKIICDGTCNQQFQLRDKRKGRWRVLSDASLFVRTLAAIFRHLPGVSLVDEVIYNLLLMTN